MKVPKNKTLYVGGQRFKEGVVLPPHILRFDIKFKEDEEQKIKSKYNKKSKKENTFNFNN